MTRLWCEAILFDFDGVLCASVDVKTRAFAVLYEEHGPAIVDHVVAYHLAHGGISRHKKFRHYETAVLGCEPTQERLDALAARFAELVEQAVVDSPYLPGAEAFLREQAGRVPMFVISGTPQDELRRIVDRRGMADFFVDVLGAPRTKDVLIAGVLREHGFAAARTVMIGDALTDHQGATASGVPFLGVVPPGHPNHFPADVTVMADLTELPGLLAQR